MVGLHESDVKYGGFVVAAIGFLGTRYTVLESIDASSTLTEFLVGQAAFLVLGLGLTVFGIGLAVSSYDETFVNTVAAWSVLGTLSMVIVLVLTLTGTEDAAQLTEFTRSALVANVLIGGSVGGVLTGIRAAMNKRHRRELSKQADRLTVLNRILRHEVLNKVNVIRGYADLDVAEQTTGSSNLQVIQRNADRIDTSISELRAIVGPASEGPVSTRVYPRLRSAIDEVRTSYPNASISLDAGAPAETRVVADAHLDTAFRHLLENAVVHAGIDDPNVSVRVSSHDSHVTVDITDEGPGIPENVAAVVEERDLPEYDDPTTGFGLTLVRLLVVDKYGGSVDVETSEDGSVVTVSLAHSTDNVVDDSSGYGIPPWVLVITAAAALVSGVAMGAVSELLTDSFAIIGALYGVMNVGVGWVTHLFHSVVFGLLFAAAVCNSDPWGATRSPAVMTGLGVAYGLFLWFFAAGIVMPLWLQLVGIDATVPTLEIPSLVAHAVWGAVFGSLFGLGVNRRR
ncbi:histidine kinase [Haloferax larsenii JCM 13917]|nr:ATP-binding protein [Haloferax larsenii]ELZ76342.1 histidine kinase [Haloferax larsenii JCM 13917]